MAGIQSQPTISKSNPNAGILFSYVGASPLPGRCAITCTHTLPYPLPSIAYVCLENAVFSEKPNAIALGSDSAVFLIGRNLNDLVSIKYDVYKVDNIGYTKVIVINNHDFPIRFGYTFSRLNPFPISEPECVWEGVDYD